MRVPSFEKKSLLSTVNYLDWEWSFGRNLLLALHVRMDLWDQL